MKPHQELWNEIISLLQQAREILNQADGSVDIIDDKQFFEYLSNNKLELALNEIECLGYNFELPRE